MHQRWHFIEKTDKTLRAPRAKSEGSSRLNNEGKQVPQGGGNGGTVMQKVLECLDSIFVALEVVRVQRAHYLPAKSGGAGTREPGQRRRRMAPAE